MRRFLGDMGDVDEELLFNDEKKTLHHLFNDIKESVETRNSLKPRPIEPRGAGYWMVPFDMIKPRSKRDFHCYYNYKEKTMIIKSYKYQTDNDGILCDGDEPEFMSEKTIKISNYTNLLEDLGGVFDQVKEGDSSIKRPTAPGKGKDLYKYIETFDLLCKNDGYKYFILRKGTSLLLHLRNINKLDGLGMNDTLLNKLAEEMMIDNNLEDIPTHDIDKGTPFLLRKSTLAKYLPVFAETTESKLSELLDILIKNKVFDKDKKQEVYKDIVRRNKKFHGKIILYKGCVEKYFSWKYKGKNYKTYDVLRYKAKKNEYIAEGDNKKYAYGFIRDAYEKALETMSILKEKGDDSWQFFLNAVVDFNIGVDKFWKEKESNVVYIPETEKYYRKYSKMQKESVKVSSLKASGGLIGYLLENGLHGQFEVGETARGLKDRYNYMNIKITKLPVGSGVKTGRLEYVKKQFKNSRKLSISPTMRKLCPYIPMQETDYRNNAKSGIGASGLWQFMSTTGKKYGLKRVDRNNIVKSTDAAIDALYDNYKTAQNNSNLIALFKKYEKYFPSWKEKDLVITCFAMNIHNSGPGHVNRVLNIMTGKSKFKRADDKEVLDKYMKKHGALGLFIFFTDHYSKYASDYQDTKTFGNTKYLIDSPKYVYNILKFYQLDMESKKKK